MYNKIIIVNMHNLLIFYYAHRFEISFPNTTALKDIRFSMLVKFQDPEVVIFRHMLNNNWRDSITYPPPFPFERGGPFNLQFDCTKTNVDIHINGSLYQNYRLPTVFTNATCLRISGDLCVSNVAFTVI